MCTCTVSTGAHAASQRSSKIPKEGEETRFLWVRFSPTLFCSVLPPTPIPWQKMETRAEWYDTLRRPLFCLTPANMQAHLSRALKPSLILWRPKHFNFFQQTSSQLALDCQWGSPNSKIYHLETHKSPLRQIFFFKASQKKEKKKKSAKPQSRNVSLHVPPSSSLSHSLFDTPGKRQI